MTIEEWKAIRAEILDMLGYSGAYRLYREEQPSGIQKRWWELTTVAWAHYKSDDLVEIPHRTAFELLMFVAAVKETYPGMFDELGLHPIQPGVWMNILQDATHLELDEKEAK